MLQEKRAAGYLKRSRGDRGDSRVVSYCFQNENYENKKIRLMNDWKQPPYPPYPPQRKSTKSMNRNFLKKNNISQY